MDHSLIFNSNKNKALLWDVLYKNAAFDHISHNNIEEVKKLFENTIRAENVNINHSQYNNPTSTLVVKNKQVIKKMMTTLKSNKFKYLKTKLQSNIHNNTPASEISSDTTSSILQQQVNKKQAEFESLMNPPQPPTPSFQDDLDEPIGPELDNMIENAIQQRKLQEQKIVNAHPPPNNFKINNGDSKKESIASIKIGNSISLTDNSVTTIPEAKYKKVSFQNNTSMKDNSIEKELLEIKQRLDNLERFKTKKQAMLSPYV